MSMAATMFEYEIIDKIYESDMNDEDKVEALSQLSFFYQPPDCAHL